MASHGFSHYHAFQPTAKALAGRSSFWLGRSLADNHLASPTSAQEQPRTAIAVALPDDSTAAPPPRRYMPMGVYRYKLEASNECAAAKDVSRWEGRQPRKQAI